MVWTFEVLTISVTACLFLLVTLASRGPGKGTFPRGAAGSQEVHMFPKEVTSELGNNDRQELTRAGRGHGYLCRGAKAGKRGWDPAIMATIPARD